MEAETINVGLIIVGFVLATCLGLATVFWEIPALIESLMQGFALCVAVGALVLLGLATEQTVVAPVSLFLACFSLLFGILRVAHGVAGLLGVPGW